MVIVVWDASRNLDAEACQALPAGLQGGVQGLRQTTAGRGKGGGGQLDEERAGGGVGGIGGVPRGKITHEPNKVEEA